MGLQGPGVHSGQDLLCISFPAAEWHHSWLLPPAPACSAPFTTHLCRVFRDLLPGTKQLPFGYSHLASGEAGAVQVPSALPKISEVPLAVGFQLQSALAGGERCYVSQGRRAPCWIPSRGQQEWGAGVQRVPLGSRSAEPQTCGSKILLPQGRQRGSPSQALLFLSHQPAVGFPQISDNVKFCTERFGKGNLKIFS